ncbi:MAG: hypothetical protein B7Z73_09035 [Planctomycetia bacterium 21-64-5]|nr:MAG: hypothetical protein B7Z73_09035 [Planctomycetia bacterium 21-64-5]HQU41394.1 hypothetical protein [Pirellulales bacterium]
MDRESKLQQLAALEQEVQQLKAELAAETTPTHWRPTGYYAAYYATTGFLLGMFGAATSLLANIIGSLVWNGLKGQPQNPLRLIQVYLTFPLGETALKIDTGITLAVGCCLYLGTGMLYGILFQLVLTRFTPNATFGRRLLVVSVLSLAVWLVNFYGILSWLQPLLLGGNWIVELVPWWVAALTHLVFGWTMVLVYPWGLYLPYQPQTEQT